MAKTVKVRRKLKRGTHTYMPPGKDAQADLVTIKGGEKWDCPQSVVGSLDPNQWDFLDAEAEADIGGPSRRTPPVPKKGLKMEPCPDQEDMWDVVNEKTGNRINDDPLTEAEARLMTGTTGGK